MRGHADAERLRAEAATASTAVVVGGGYIGLEVAAALRGLGLAVTVIEVGDRLLGWVTGPVVAEYFARRHREPGVDLRLGRVSRRSRVLRVGRPVSVRRRGRVPGDLVVVGVGLVPNVDVLAAAGARTDGGIEVDEFCRTSLPDVHAVGDAVSFPISLYGGRRVRLESVQNASDQAKVIRQSHPGRSRALRPGPVVLVPPVRREVPDGRPAGRP